MPESYYVYLLTNRSRTLYIGVTNSLVRRVQQHQQRQIPGFTKRSGRHFWQGRGYKANQIAPGQRCFGQGDFCRKSCTFTGPDRAKLPRFPQLSFWTPHSGQKTREVVGASGDVRCPLKTEPVDNLWEKSPIPAGNHRISMCSRQGDSLHHWTGRKWHRRTALPTASCSRPNRCSHSGPGRANRHPWSGR
jgi:hypothetical protein